MRVSELMIIAAVDDTFDLNAHILNFASSRKLAVNTPKNPKWGFLSGGYTHRLTALLQEISLRIFLHNLTAAAAFPAVDLLRKAFRAYLA